MHRRLLHVDLGAAGPDHDEAIAAVLFLERADVGDHLFGEVALVLALLDVGTLQPLDVALIEDRGHRADRLELAADLIELRCLEDAGRARGGVAVVFEDVPAAKDDVVEIGERDELLDLRRAAFGAFPETDGAHLRQRSDRQREPLRIANTPAIVVVADRAEADEQHAELAACRGDLNW